MRKLIKAYCENHSLDKSSKLNDNTNIFSEQEGNQEELILTANDIILQPYTTANPDEVTTPSMLLQANTQDALSKENGKNILTSFIAICSIESLFVNTKVRKDTDRHE